MTIVSYIVDFFNVPEQGELFDEVEFVEQDETESKRTVEGYHREGRRNRERGEEPEYKRQRFDNDRRGNRRDDGRYGTSIILFLLLLWFCLFATCAIGFTHIAFYE